MASANAVYDKALNRESKRNQGSKFARPAAGRDAPSIVYRPGAGQGSNRPKLLRLPYPTARISRDGNPCQEEKERRPTSIPSREGKKYNSRKGKLKSREIKIKLPEKENKPPSKGNKPPLLGGAGGG